MTRYDIINQFIKDRNYNSFLEIGTAQGETFRQVIAPIRVSVDPDEKTMATFRMTSDDFFAMCKNKFDIIFIDGLHEHKQAFRDVKNALQFLNEGGVVVMHDCLPTSELMQEYPRSPHNYIWTGDVWKAFVALRTEQPYEMYTIDTDYGCGIIDTTLKKKSSTTKLPKDMETLTYDQFTSNRDKWMNVKEGIINA